MDPSDHIQKLGQQEYRRRNFLAALGFFNFVSVQIAHIMCPTLTIFQIISQERNPAVSVLDNRAATYEKLGDFHAALKDGRRIISDHKTSCAVWPGLTITTIAAVCISKQYKGLPPDG